MNIWTLVVVALILFACSATTNQSAGGDASKAALVTLATSTPESVITLPTPTSAPTETRQAVHPMRATAVAIRTDSVLAKYSTPIPGAAPIPTLPTPHPTATPADVGASATRELLAEITPEVALPADWSNLSLPDLESLHIGNEVMRAFSQAVMGVPLHVTMEWRTTSGYERGEHWIVSFANLLDDPQEWLASGTVFKPSSDKTFAFDSRYESTCFKRTSPGEGNWLSEEHNGWFKIQNPGKFTPVYPFPYMVHAPTAEWRTVGLTDAEVTLSMSVPNSGYVVVHVDSASRLIIREEWTSLGTLDASVTYTGYGENNISNIHADKADCTARND